MTKAYNHHIKNIASLLIKLKFCANKIQPNFFPFFSSSLNTEFLPVQHIMPNFTQADPFVLVSFAMTSPSTTNTTTTVVAASSVVISLERRVSNNKSNKKQKKQEQEQKRSLHDWAIQGQ